MRTRRGFGRLALIWRVPLAVSILMFIVSAVIPAYANEVRPGDILTLQPVDF
jgi:hypothetical protein